MPIYEYQCRNCGYRLDALQKMSDPPLIDCPECGQASLKKLVSAPHFRLKGSGWYETDFKNSGREKSGGGDKESTPEAAGGGKEASSGKDAEGGKSESGSATGKDAGASSASGAAAA